MRKNSQYGGSSSNLGNLQDLQSSLIQEAISGLAAEYGAAWKTMPPEQKMNLAKQRAEEFNDFDDAASLAAENADQQADMIGDMVGMASTKNIFSLSKISQAPMPQTFPMEGEPSMQDDTMGQQYPMAEENSSVKFRDAAHLRDYLEQSENIDSVISEFMQFASDQPVVDKDGSSYNPRQRINDEVKAYIEGRETLTDQEKLEIAMNIFESLPQSVKEEDQSPVDGTQVSGINTVVADSNLAVKAAAEKMARNQKKTAKSFNMKKHAQHKATENLFLFGPGQVRVDPFTGDLASNFSAYERNKGFGLKVDDALDIDYETIWRSTVMDKYFRPYKDKEGNWVGGYLEKRFETDKWQPEGNRLQLEPGQRRRAYLPEFRSMESRLQDLRSKEDPRGRVFNNTDKPFDWAADGTTSATFNWKMASSSKKKMLVK